MLSTRLLVDLRFFQGKFAAALEHYERMIALSDSLPCAVLSSGFDAEQGTTARSGAAWTLWQLGWPDRALA
jgi:hypothetical protein